jgi:hypothetical protein
MHHHRGGPDSGVSVYRAAGSWWDEKNKEADDARAYPPYSNPGELVYPPNPGVHQKRKG